MFPLSQNPSSSSRGNSRGSSSSHNPHNRNYGAAFFQMMTIALLCTSLAQPSWLSLTTRTPTSTSRSGGGCPKHLTLYQFFDYGYFETGDSRNSTIIVTPVRLYYHSAAGTMACLTPAIVNMFKVILMLVIFAIILCFIGFLLDVLGTKSRLSLTVRSNGLLTIPIVLICAGVVSLAYYITVLLEKENRHSYFLEVSFDYGFFTLSSAGATALLATASALFKRMGGPERRRSRSRHRRSRSSRLRDSRLMLVDTVESPPLVVHGDPPPPYSL
ncbi:transmembrane protein 127-like [Daphnia carinata]|uniref:transmembrane protein 127-like n=1 Tax=Daphnia carinata TaxID=120202 RepID=UPI0025805A57|nr:transmembrane protein 127-like [Daphnia carinata]